MITFGELLNLSQNIVIPRKRYANDYIISSDDLLNGKTFPSFKLNKRNPLLTINGIKLNKEINYSINDIKIYYQILDRIEIIADKNIILPKGENVTLKTYAYLRLYSYDINNRTPLLIEENKVEIKTIYHIDNNISFKIKDNILYSSINDTEEERKVNISTVYRLGKNSCTSTICIKQLVNKESEWLYKGTIEGSLSIQTDYDAIGKDGGICNVQVFQDNIRQYYKTDTNDEILDKIKEEHNIDNVTSLCNISADNNSFVQILGNRVIFAKQPLNNSSRQVTIMAQKGISSASKTIFQEKGAVVTYAYNAAFKTQKKVYNLNLETSLECDAYVPFSFIQEQMADGVIIGKIGVSKTNIKIDIPNNDWCFTEICDNDSDGEYLLHITIYKDNLSKEYNRQIEADINYLDEHLMVIISQPSLKVVNHEYDIEVNGISDYDANTINDACITFKPYIKNIYEDKSFETESIDYNNYHLKLLNDTIANNNMMITRLYLSDFNGIYSSLFKVDENCNDASLCFKVGLFDNNDNLLVVSKNVIVNYHKPIIKTEYEFSIINPKECIWESEWKDDDVTIEINSLKTQYIDNKANYNRLPFIICNKDNIRHFNIKISDNNIIIKPKEANNTNEDIIENIVLRQGETDSEIEISLMHLKQESKDIIIKISVIVHCDDIIDEIWSSDSTLYVTQSGDTIYTLSMTPCWLYENSLEDVIYQGYLKLKANTEYMFSTKYFKLKHPSRDNDYNFEEKITFGEEDNDVEFFIDI